MEGELNSISGAVDRDATSLRGGYQNDKLRWHSAIEYREDTGVEHRNLGIVCVGVVKLR